MHNFSFYNPTRIHFGEGTIKLLSKEIKSIGANKLLLVAGGGSIKGNGVYEQVIDALKNSQVAWVENWGVRANPTLDKVREIIDYAKREKVDAIVAVGGGSVIDTAKAVACGVYLSDVWNAFIRKEAISKALPLFTVLTISATGSEMNGNAVITNTAERKKWAIYSPLIYPVASIIDPTVQQSLPWQQTVNGALDAMAHILEYYFIDDKALVTLGINDTLLRTIVEMTDALKNNPEDKTLRANLAWCATLALNGITSLGLKGGDWACHQIEHGLSALNPLVAHGEGLGVIFPAWIEFMSERRPESFYRWAKNVWNEVSTAVAIQHLRDKIKEWGSAGSLRELGFKKSDLPVLVEIICTSPTIGEFSKLTKADIEALLYLAF